MANEELDKLLNTGIQAARAGNRVEARRLLEKVLEQDDSNEQAWLALASVVDTPRERRICLENVLEINPNNERARQALERLKPSPASGAVTATTPPPSPVSTLGSARRGGQQPIKAPSAPAGVSTTEGSKEAWRKQRSQGGIDPQVLFFVLLAVTVIGVGILLVTGGGPNSGATPTPGPSATPTRPSRATLTPTLENVPTLNVELITPAPPTWTPAPSETPPPTFTLSPTPPVLVNYRLVFVVGEGTAARAFTMRGDGTNRQALLNRAIFNPAYTADGRKIAYVTDRDGSDQVGIASADGSDEIIIAVNVGGRVRSAAWAPDGSQLVVSTETNGNPDIYLVNADGSGLRRLYDGGFADIDPVFSPDGKTILFASDTTGRNSYQIFSLPSTATGDTLPTQLTSSGGQNLMPSYAADGSRIVFISTRNRALGKVFVMRADGTDERPLVLDDGGAENRSPVFSPDGRYLAFVSNRNGGVFQVFVTEVSSGRVVQQITSERENVLSVFFRPGF